MDAGGVDQVETRAGVELCCPRCQKKILICRPCWRNQSYCSKQCSDEAYLERKRRNQRKYTQTAAGRENHRLRQKKYRLRQKYQD